MRNPWLAIPCVWFTVKNFSFSPGKPNHDLDFAWPRVQQIVRGRIGGGDRLSFIVGNTRYGGVLIEHGYQFTPENCPKDPVNFIHDHQEGGKVVRYLERVWGTDFMLQFYNELEKDHPYADNVKPMLRVLYYAVKKRWITVRDVLRLLLFLKRRGIQWKAVASTVLANTGEVEPALVRDNFVEGVWYDLISEGLEDEEFVESLHQALNELDKAEAALLVGGEPINLEVDPTDLVEDKSGTLGVFREAREPRAARKHLEKDGITAVVYGHTHEIVDGYENFLFNPGTWLPHLDLAAPHVLAKLKAQGLTKEMLKDPSLYKVDRRAVLIEPNGVYQARVRLVSIP
jgi:hypothetical protein